MYDENYTALKISENIIKNEILMDEKFHFDPVFQYDLQDEVENFLHLRNSLFIRTDTFEYYQSQFAYDRRDKVIDNQLISAIDSLLKKLKVQ